MNSRQEKSVKQFLDGDYDYKSDVSIIDDSDANPNLYPPSGNEQGSPRISPDPSRSNAFESQR